MNIKEITKKTLNESGTKNDSRILKIIKGSVIAILITLILLIIFSVVLANTNVNENTIVPVVTAIVAISILIGSIISISKIEKKGLLNGALVGLIYIITTYLFSSIVIGSFAINLNSVILMVAAVLAGMLGGIIGVNIKK